MKDLAGFSTFNYMAQAISILEYRRHSFSKSVSGITHWCNKL